jgi:hypothetical protein
MNSNSNSEAEKDNKAARMNPWLGIWLHTRETLLFVWQNLLEDYVHRLFMLLGLVFMLVARLPDWSSITPHPIGVMVQMLLFAPIGGIMAGYIFSALVRAIGQRMGKSVPSAPTKSMVAWSNLPFIATWTIFLIVFWILNRSMGPAHPQKIWLFSGFLGWLPLLAALPMYIWAVLIRVRSIQVLLGLPSSRAFLVWAVATFITYVPTAAITYVYLILYFVTGASGGS